MAEKTVIISATTLVFGLILLVGVFFFDAGFAIPGLDPHLVAVAFADAFLVIGVLGIAVGVRQHDRADHGPHRRRRPRAR